MAMNPDIAQLKTSEGFYPMKCTGVSCHYKATAFNERSRDSAVGVATGYSIY